MKDKLDELFLRFSHASTEPLIHGARELASGHNRIKVDKQLRLAKAFQVANLPSNIENSYVPQSGLDRYARRLRGVSETLKNIPNKYALDIGTGDARAPYEIGQKYGLDFLVTDLIGDQVIPEMQDSLLITNAESLGGIPLNFFGLALFVESVGFSEDPEQVIREIDKRVVEGGIVKGTFMSEKSYGPYWNRVYQELGYKPHDKFSRALERRGYDVVVSRAFMNGQDDVMLAVKPGNCAPQASYLLAKDEISYLKQYLARH